MNMNLGWALFTLVIFALCTVGVFVGLCYTLKGKNVFGTEGHKSTEFKLVVAFISLVVAELVSLGLWQVPDGEAVPAIGSWLRSLAIVLAAYAVCRTAVKIVKMLTGWQKPPQE